MNTDQNSFSRAGWALLAARIGRPPGDARLQFTAMGALGAALVWGLLAAAAGAVWSPAAVWALSAYGIGFAMAFRALRRSYPHDRLGLCNVVTLVRMALVGALSAGLVPGALTIGPMLALALTAFALDGVDGWLARRAGLASEFGARFDVEVDSVFALLLAALAVQTGLSPLVLLLGLPRYAFGVAQVAVPRLTGTLPERFSRKTVCVVQILVLIALTVPWIDPGLRHGLAALAGGLVLWSFTIDIRALLRAPE